MKKCSSCQTIKDYFYFSPDKGKKDGLASRCKECRNKAYLNSNKKKLINENKRLNYKKYKEKENAKKRKFYSENKETVKQWNKNSVDRNKPKIKKRKAEYYAENREDISLKNKKYSVKNRDKRNKREKKKREDNPEHKIRCYVSGSINKMLKKTGGSKEGNSSSKYLLFTKYQLKEHLEKLFEPWMNWNNWGVYNMDTWNDNDPSTWTWQLDHIVPQSDLPYVSMQDENFKICWSLNNLRPYSAKQNNIDGAKRTRHNKK
jgi:hypothetical protein